MAWLYQTPNFKKIGLAEILQIDFKVDPMFYSGQPEGRGAHLSLTLANAGALIYSEGWPCKSLSNQLRPDELAVNKGDYTTEPETTLRHLEKCRLRADRTASR